MNFGAALAAAIIGLATMIVGLLFLTTVILEPSPLVHHMMGSI